MADADVSAQSQRFFKTGEGEYGEGDRFLGIRVPELRSLLKRFGDSTLEDIQKLLRSEFHEERLFSLLLMVRQFNRGSQAKKSAILSIYLENTLYINNWDLVDSSAYKIVGPYLEGRDRSVLYRLAKSSNLWERRIAIMSTLHFIRNRDFEDALKLSKILMHDKEDLLHKAVGWMLREVGIRDSAAEKTFLRSNYKLMPRTMLRYAIEKFPENERKQYLAGTI